MLKTFLAIIFIAIVLLSGGIISYIYFFSGSSSTVEEVNQRHEITVGNTPLLVGFAQTEKERTRGLSGRANLPENEGLFFIFEKNSIHPFWMKEMHFPIDIIWISDDFVVSDITKNLSPNSFPKSFISTKPVRYVLEVNAGFSDTHEIHIGDAVLGISSGVTQ